MENKALEILDQLQTLIRVFSSDSYTDYDAVRQLYHNLDDYIIPYMYKTTTSNKGREKREVICLDDYLNFDSSAEAAEHYKISMQTIRLSCNTGLPIQKIGKTFQFIN